MLSDEKKILEFDIQNLSYILRQEGLFLHIFLYEPLNSSLLFTPTITVSDFASIYPPSRQPQVISYTDGIKYTVTAQSGNTKDYFVKVHETLVTDKTILDFTIPNKTVIVHLHEQKQKIYVEVYHDVDITTLAPIITIPYGTTISPRSGETVDFTNPITYTTTAQDGSTASYIVEVSRSQTSDPRHNIEAFELVGIEQILERDAENFFIYIPYETDITNIKTNISIPEGAQITPESGVPVNFTTPQTYVVTSSVGTAREYTVTVKKSPWRLLTDNPPFSTRDDLFLCEMNGYMYMYRGWFGGHPITGEPWYSPEIWKSNDGLIWQQVTDAIPWAGSAYFKNYQSFIKFNNKVWVYGGGESGLEIWSSTDGENFVKSSQNIPFGRRYWPYIGVLNNKLWLTGGMNWWDDDGNYIRDGYGTSPYNDIWSSTDGENWVKEKDFSQIPPRGLINGFVEFDGNLLIIGGGISNGTIVSSYNDIWSTNNGVYWKRMVVEAEFRPTTYHSILNHNGRLFLIAGDEKNKTLSNESWYSSDGGYTWKQVKYGFYKERHASGLISFKGKLYMVAGFECRDIWVLDEERL